MRQLPNLLTGVRIVLTPFIVYTLLSGNCPRALLWSCIAGATDGADGMLARRFGWLTRTGAYLDPIADKLLLTSLYISFGVLQLAPWWLVWLVFGRDLLILGMAAGAILTTRHRDFPPTIWGKLCTVVQIAAVIVILTGCAYGAPDVLISGAIWLTAAVTAWSGVHYTWRAIAWSGERRHIKN